MNQEYTQRLKKIEIELERWLPSSLSGNPVNSDSASNFIMPAMFPTDKIFSGTGNETDVLYKKILLEPAGELLYRGGKRWRPLLMTLICETLGGGDTSLPLSPLVEFSHNASLIHDDIEDQSDERRGKPAVHKMFGADTAINSGSFFYFLASCCIDNCAFTYKEKIYKLWLESMRNLHLGQSMDIYWHRETSIFPEIKDYFLMCRMKTGSLARLAAELGAFAANAPPETARSLSGACEMMGVGFQILDDVKNLTTGIPGKKRGDDIAENKKSLPVLLFIQKFPEKKADIIRCFDAAKKNGVNAPEVEEMINILAKSGILTEAEEKGMSILKETREIFDSFGKNNTLLKDFIDLIS